MVYLAHWRYVLIHKWLVFRFGLRFGVPLWRLVVHDLSKFGWTETCGYAPASFTPDGVLRVVRVPSTPFARAVAHHHHHNPHHWQHWVTIHDDGRLEATPMPAARIREMVADWHAAARQKRGDVNQWYAQSAILLHPDTRASVDTLMNACAICSDVIESKA